MPRGWVRPRQPALSVARRVAGWHTPTRHRSQQILTLSKPSVLPFWRIIQTVEAVLAAAATTSAGTGTATMQ
jgi:hypothetical protein